MALGRDGQDGVQWNDISYMIQSVAVSKNSRQRFTNVAGFSGERNGILRVASLG
jgi:hypothetical protein